MARPVVPAMPELPPSPVESSSDNAGRKGEPKLYAASLRMTMPIFQVHLKNPTYIRESALHNFDVNALQRTLKRSRQRADVR
jgi:hypothetical protein